MRAGEFLAIVGPSGCGKSTLLNVIVGLLKPSAGRIGFKGKAVNGIQRDVGYVTQADNLLPWRNLIDNVAFALELRGYPKSERYARADPDHLVRYRRNIQDRTSRPADVFFVLLQHTRRHSHG